MSIEKEAFINTIKQFQLGTKHLIIARNAIACADNTEIVDVSDFLHTQLYNLYQKISSEMEDIHDLNVLHDAGFKLIVRTNVSYKDIIPYWALPITEDDTSELVGCVAFVTNPMLRILNTARILNIPKSELHSVFANIIHKLTIEEGQTTEKDNT